MSINLVNAPLSLWFCNSNKNASNLINQFKVCSRSTFIYSNENEKANWMAAECWRKLNRMKIKQRQNERKKQNNNMVLTYLGVAHSANCNFLCSIHSFASAAVGFH